MFKKFRADLAHARKYGQMRPLWQIAILLPLFPIYKLAQGIIWLFEECF